MDASAKYGKRTAFSLFQDGAVCEERRISYSTMAQKAKQLGRFLIETGVQPGGRVMLMADNCPEWPLAYFGIAMAGAVSVPLLTGFSAEQVQYIAGHAEVSAVILSRSMISKVDKLQITLPLIFIDSMTDSIAISVNGMEKRFPLPSSEGEFPKREPNDLAVIIYTSGTSGKSKGVMLSNSNILSCALSTLKMIKLYPWDRLVSVLPLAHAYECCLGLVAPVISGSSICYLDRPPSSSVLLPAARSIRPTIMITVPVFLEKMYRSAIVPKLQKSKLYRLPLTRPLVLYAAGKKLIKTLGGSIRFFGIGGAPLSPETEKFLRSARFPFAMGYGLTEAAPLVAGSVPFKFPFRSTGKTSPGVEMRIVPDGEENAENDGNSVGEIQVRGPNIMLGYYRNEEQTREAFTADGWLRTGDLGRFDKKNRIFVCGRIKSLILGPCGENIYPEEIEGMLGGEQIVEEALVYPGKKGELVAMVRLSAPALEHALEDLREKVNKRLASFSRLSRIEIRNEPFEKTPTMKIKRYLYAQA